MKQRRNALIILLIGLFLAQCRATYQEKISAAEAAFFAGDPERAVQEIQLSSSVSGEQDRLLYYLEAAITRHTAGDYRGSNKILDTAAEIIGNQRASVTGAVQSFLISDATSDFTGEKFEQVLVHWYRALNYTLMDDKQAARKTLLRLEADLKDMKYENEAYQQVLAARYLSALLAEDARDFNTARVQYRNLELFKVDQHWLEQQKKIANYFESGKTGNVKLITQSGTRNIKPGERPGQIVIIHQAGKAPVKESRGKLSQDQRFWIAMRAAVQANINSRGAGLTTTSAMAALAFADNPIPEYKPRDEKAASLSPFYIGTTAIYPYLLTDYNKIALTNFNDNYSTMVTKNISSLAVKFVTAAIASGAIGNSADEAAGGGVGGALLKILVGAGTGAVVASTIAPDLRSWRMLPANFQITRELVEPGKYRLSVELPSGVKAVSNLPTEIEVSPGETVFLNLRSFSINDSLQDS